MNVGLGGKQTFGVGGSLAKGVSFQTDQSDDLYRVAPEYSRPTRTC